VRQFEKWHRWSRWLAGHRGLAAAAIILVAGASAPGQTIAIPSPLRPVVGGVPGIAVALELDHELYAAAGAAQQVHVGAFILEQGRAVDLVLERFEVLAPDAALVIAEGEPAIERPAARPDVVLLRGSVAGQPASSVFLGLSPHGSQGFVRLPGIDGEQVYIISTPPAEGPTVVYNLTSLPEGVIDWVEFRCGVGDALMQAREGGGANGRSSSPCRRLRVAIDTDWEYTQRFGGNAAAAQAYISTLMGAVGEVYTRDINTRVEVVFMRVWATPGDPYFAGNIDDRLNEFRAYWNANMQGVSRHIAHMLSGVRAGSGGVAWLGALCSSSFGYGISGYINGYFPYPLANNHPQNWDVAIVAHEIGHNLSAPHTHAMAPPVDACGSGDCTGAHLGTIMSYCHQCTGGMSNIRLEMHPRVASEHILPYLNTACSLLLSPAAVSQSPVARTIHQGQGVQFVAQGTGTGPLTYRWRRDGMDLMEGPGITGTDTSVLTIDPAGASHGGAYTVRISNTCNIVESAPATLTVLAPCYANCDMSTSAPLLNVDDFICFVSAFSEAQALPYSGQVGHYANCDASTVVPVLNVLDYLCFIEQFAAGCP
jgi:hypothetical protein